MGSKISSSTFINQSEGFMLGNKQFIPSIWIIFCLSEAVLVKKICISVKVESHLLWVLYLIVLI